MPRINHSRRNLSYGFGNPLQVGAPLPIIAQRDPTTADIAELSTTWVNPISASVWTLASVTGNVATWVASAGSGTGVFTDVTITGGAGLDVLTIDDGNMVVSNGDVTLSGLLTAGSATINGLTTLNGNLDVTGDVTITGDIDITDTGSISLTSTNDAAGAITLTANGGTSETILITSLQGTSASSLNLVSAAGGLTATIAGLVSLNSARNNAQAILLNASAGGIDINAAGAAGEDIDIVNTAGSVNISAGESAADSIVITSLIGGIDIIAAGASAGEDIDISAVGSSVNVSSTENAALAIYLHANGGTSETVDIHSDQGTGVASINVHSDVGGVTVASGLASADAINITASDAGGGIDIDSGTAGFIVDTTGAISLDAAAASNFTATGAFDVTVSSTAGSVIVSGGEAVADAVQLTAGNAAGGVTVATGTGGVTVNSTNGIIALNSGTAAINVGTDAVAHTVTVGNITGATAVAINSGTGHITLTSTGTGDIILNSDDTMLLDADGVLELNSSAGVISIGNDADAQGINVGTGAAARPIVIGNTTAGTTVTINSPANVGVTLPGSIRIITGAGSPDTVVTAPAGSLYLRTDPAGATSRAYINTDSATAWTNITCAA